MMYDFRRRNKKVIDMKRCILYGVGAFKRRRWIENFLDEKEYEIIG